MGRLDAIGRDTDSQMQGDADHRLCAGMSLMRCIEEIRGRARRVAWDAAAFMKNRAQSRLGSRVALSCGQLRPLSRDDIIRLGFMIEVDAAQRVLRVGVA